MPFTQFTRGSGVRSVQVPRSGEVRAVAPEAVMTYCAPEYARRWRSLVLPVATGAQPPVEPPVSAACVAASAPAPPASGPGVTVPVSVVAAAASGLEVWPTSASGVEVPPHAN